jgi:2-C-methyl-D-erythritol 4-phosphate cytidylyltransferase
MDSQLPVWGLIPAAGRGDRFGGDVPKQLVGVAGRPLLSWTLERLLACGLAGVTVALPEAWLGSGLQLQLVDRRIRWVAGGETRQESVQACLADSPTSATLILVHDGARAAVGKDDVQATIEAARLADGAILGRPVADTLKRIREDRIVSTVDRQHLFRAETPQVFGREILVRALSKSRSDGFEGTDEASLVERLPGTVIRVVAARSPNPKLTTAADLAILEMLLTREESRS